MKEANKEIVSLGNIGRNLLSVDVGRLCSLEGLVELWKFKISCLRNPEQYIT